MRKLIGILTVAAAVLVASACEFRPLAKVGNTHYVRVYLDEHILNTTEGFYNPDHVRPDYRRPEIMRVVLADRTTGRTVAERYLRNQGDDEKGHYYDGYIICDSGDWALLAWNFDTEATLLSGVSEIYGATAYTNNIAAHLYSALRSSLKAASGGMSKGEESGTKTDIDWDKEKIVYEPDHLFVAKCDDVSVGYSDHVDTLMTPDREYFTASSIVEAWYIQVNVKGISRMSSSLSLLSGLSGTKRLFSGALDPDNPVTVYFDMVNGSRTKAESDEGVLYSTFCTFGKLPERQNGFNVTFDIATKFGKAVSATFDITDEFGKDIAKEHRWIILDRTIVIPDAPPGGQGGGFSPGVTDWNDVNTDLKI